VFVPNTRPPHALREFDLLRSLLRRFAPRVSMVKSSQSRSPNDPGVGFRRTLRRSPGRRVAEDGMNAFVVVVGDVLVEESFQRLLEPSTLQPFLHDQMLVPRDHPNRFDQGLAVGLDREVLELPALLGNHR
jgi:hypothetical protein